MNGKNNLVLIIIIVIAVAVIFFIVGTVTGIFYQTNKDSVAIKKASIASGFMQSLNTSLVSTIVISGTVDSVNGRVVTLTAQNQKLSVNIATWILVSSFDKIGATKIISFGDIKKGDSLSVGARMTQTGQLEAQTVMLMSSKK